MTTVISVRFRNGTKTYYFDPRALTVAAGDDVVVETAQGLEFAQCAEGNHQVPDEQIPSEPESLSLKDAEEERIRKALEKYSGNRKQAAAELGISERTLYRRLKGDLK